MSNRACSSDTIDDTDSERSREFEPGERRRTDRSNGVVVSRVVTSRLFADFKISELFVGVFVVAFGV